MHNYFDTSNYYTRVRDRAAWNFFGTGYITPPNYYESFACLEKNVYSLNSDSSGFVQECPPFSALFCYSKENSHFILVALESGEISLINVSMSNNETPTVLKWSAHSNAIFDMKWLEADKKLITASGDHTITLHDFPSVRTLCDFIGHNGTVKSLSVKKTDPNIFVSSSRDGSFRIWDTRNCILATQRGKTGLTSIMDIQRSHIPNLGFANSKCNSKRSSTNNGIRSLRSRTSLNNSHKCSDLSLSVTCALFKDEYFIYTSGCSDGKIKVWDMRRLKMRENNHPLTEIPYSGLNHGKNGFADMTFDAMQSRLFAFCLDNVIYEYNTAFNDPKPVNIYANGHLASSFYIKLNISSDGKRISCGSDNASAYLYPIEQPFLENCGNIESPTLLPNHESEVTSCIFSPNDPTIIATICDDCNLRVWRWMPNANDERYYAKKEIHALSVCLRNDLTSPVARLHRELLTPPDGEKWMAPHEKHLLNTRARKQTNIDNFMKVNPMKFNSASSPFSSPSTSSSLITCKRSVSLCVNKRTFSEMVMINNLENENKENDNNSSSNNTQLIRRKLSSKRNLKNKDTSVTSRRNHGVLRSNTVMNRLASDKKNTTLDQFFH